MGYQSRADRLMKIWHGACKDMQSFDMKEIENI
jgi:hypothetical protein